MRKSKEENGLFEQEKTHNPINIIDESSLNSPSEGKILEMNRFDQKMSNIYFRNQESKQKNLLNNESTGLIGNTVLNEYIVKENK